MQEKYKIIADYHTHTTFSHGKGSVRDNVLKARELGLKTIAITDHAPKHFLVGVTQKGLVAQQAEIRALSKEFTDIEILWGLEGNLMGISGKTDITDELSNSLDIILCGFHKPVFADKISDYFKLYFNSYSHFLLKPSKKQISNNTKAYINAIKNNRIDIITHINYHLRVNCSEVAKACCDYNTVIELSSRHSDCTEKDYEDMFKTNVMFAINSDAHITSNIANCQKALEVIKKNNIDSKRIVNCEGTDFIFRSRRK